MSSHSSHVSKLARMVPGRACRAVTTMTMTMTITTTTTTGTGKVRVYVRG
jgi:hypothetical protein